MALPSYGHRRTAVVQNITARMLFCFIFVMT